jgi:predicted alpha/beta superfamily hydrolase
LKTNTANILQPVLMAIICLIVAVPLVAEEVAEVEAPDPVISVGEMHTIKSQHLAEDRPYLVYLPNGCKEEGANAPCPVLYILDGSAHFHYGSGMLARMSRSNQIPEMIMVAVPNTADRMHDLTPTHTLINSDGEESPEYSTTGGGNDFLDFVEKELIPEVEERYKPMPYRIFSGHSLGGLLALHSFVERPGLFQAYIVVDPSLWWDKQELVTRAENYLKTSADVRNKIFITIAEHRPRGGGSKVVMETSGERFAYALEANPSPHLYSALRQFSGEDHGSVAMPSLYYGLLFVFDGYKNPPPAVTSQGLEAVSKYYSEYLGAYQLNLTPPQAVFADMARLANENDEEQKALEYLQHNVAMHPESAFAEYGLAMAYKDSGKKDLAIEHFQRALELAPQYEAYIKPILTELGADE